MKREYDNQPREAIQDLTPPLRLFVYGTLKSGERNHERFCQGAITIQDAWTYGKVHHPSMGLLMVEVEMAFIVSIGTGMYLNDLVAQEKEVQRYQQGTRTSDRAEKYEKRQQRISGELLVLPSATTLLPALDRFEGFYPGKPSFYRRLLVPVWTEAGPSVAWMYGK